MRLRCLFGRHRWHLTTYTHKPCRYNDQEFGRRWAQCTDCPKTRGNLPIRWCLCEDFRLRTGLVDAAAFLRARQFAPPTAGGDSTP
ncbi:hypothetical protein [Nocardia sp. NPDC004260]